jgi:CNT family concentrative nucleoside transporter
MEKQTPEKGHMARNLDPALDPAREHHHEHLHHDANAEKGRHDDPVYTIGTTAERSNVPDQDPMDHALHRRHHPERAGSGDKSIDKDPTVAYDDKYDAEKGTADQEADPQNHNVSRFYRKYRIFFHLFLLLLFTG